MNRGLRGLLVSTLVIALLVVGAVVASNGSGQSATPGPGATGSTATVSTAGATIEFAPRASDLPPIGPAALPPEALDTLQRIATNGPYPYSNDGTVFENREGLLPSAESGYYREYTVETPGSADRGARRIVTGAGGELFYTDDHYDSFFEIVPGAG